MAPRYQSINLNLMNHPRKNQTPLLQEPWDFGQGLYGTHWYAPQPCQARLLLLHGYGEDSGRYVTQYHSLIPTLVAGGVSVYAYDQQGHGNSGGKKGNANQLLCTHLAARQALETLQTTPLFLYGHSMGGLITAASVLERPTNIDGVILSSPALLLGEDEPNWLKAIAPLLMKYCPELPVKRLSSRDLFQNNPQANKAAWIPAITAVSLLHLTETLWARYDQWHVPTLIFHGSADRLAPVEGSRRFVKLIASQEKTYLEIENGFHELLNDPEPEELRGQILHWILRQLHSPA